MLIRRNHSQGGFTITELMVGLLVGMITVGAAINIYLVAVRTSSETLREAKLVQELRTIMEIMVSDIRRAGYWASAVAGSPDNPPDNVPVIATGGNPQVDPDNPFTVSGTTNVNVLNGGSCVIYAYDATYRGGTTGVDATDFFGFRLSGNNLEMLRSGGTTTANCNDDNGTWNVISDPNTVSITGLTFSTAGSQCLNTTTGATWTTPANSTIPACNCPDADTCTGYVAPTTGDLLVETRQLNIALAAQHVSDATVQVQFSEQVRLRNNRIIVAP